MLTATITTPSGQTVTLQGSPDEIGAAIAAIGGAPQPVRRGPGRPRKDAVNGVATVNSAPAPAKPRKTLSPEAQKARVLQGQYMGTLRGLGAADKKKVQAVAKAKGVGEAIKVAKTIAAKAKK